MGDVPFAEAELFVLVDRQHPAVAAGVHAALFEVVAHGITFRRAGTAEGIVTTTGIGDDLQHGGVFIGAQHRPCGQVDVALLADGVHGAVALGRIFGAVKQGVSGLITFQIENTHGLARGDDTNEIITGIDDGAAHGTVEFECTFGQHDDFPMLVPM